MKGGNHCLQLALRYRRAFWQIRGDETRNLVKGASELKSTIAETTLGAPSRFVKRGVRFVQLIHSTWDHHTELETGLEKQCLATDRPAAALVADLKQRGLLDSTLVVWGGEFGRTPMVEDRTPSKDASRGRDHHRLAFSMWLSGGGIRAGHVVGRTDDLGLEVVENPVGVNDLQATILHCLGLDHTKLTYRYQGRDFCLTDVRGNVVRGMLA